MVRLRGHGIEWIIDATGCDPARLQDRATLQGLFDDVVRELGLHPIGRPAWHKFPGTHGHTGLWMLRESHLACHTFPEYAGLCVNLYCCRPRPLWPWRGRLRERVGARTVTVRSVRRDYAGDAAEESA